MPHVLRVLLDSMYANFVDMSTVCILSTEGGWAGNQLISLPISQHLIHWFSG